MIIRWTVRLCLLVILVALPLGAFSPEKMSVGAETAIPTYGAPTFLDGSPVGGGSGYLNTVDESEADYVVDTAAELKSALAAAKSGEIVYVADGATITITSSYWYGNTASDIDCGCYLKAGVTLAGGRGKDGVTGGIIKVSTSLQPKVLSVLIWCAGSGCRVTGLTLVGAQDGTTGDNMWCGIWAGDDANIDNNEIHGFGYGGVRVDRDINDVWIHHNYIHHNRQSGYGYGVMVNAYNIDHTSSAIVEGNEFDYCRHVISGSRGRSSYTFRYNYLGANCTNTQIDVHGQNAGGDYLDKDDGEYIFCAGENTKIYNNTSVCTSNPFVGIRGIPYSTGSVSVHNNWTYTTSTQEWQLSSDRPKVRTINEQMDNIPGYGYIAPKGGAFVRMSSYSNWYGTKSPPESNQPPLKPAAPSGPVSGDVGTSYTYKVVTTDPDGDAITYTVDWGDGTTYTSSSKSSGTAVYPTNDWASAGTYAVKVKATDSAGNVSAWSSSLTVTIAGGSTASQSPLTPAAPSGPVSGEAGISYTYRVKTTDPDGDTIAYTIDWGDGTSHTTSSKSSGTTAYPAHIWAKAGAYAVKVKATDSAGNSSAWSPSLTVTITGVSTANQTPLAPAAPSGAVSGKTGTSYTYSVKTTDPDGDAVTYTIDWGDATSQTTGSEASGTTAYPVHAWANAGTYAVKVNATDSAGNVSAWSPSLAVTITAGFDTSAVSNSAPMVPVAPSGTTSALASFNYAYSAVTTDPDGDALSYTFDFGDGTVLTVYGIDSGATAYASHVWAAPGTYCVIVNAADSKGTASGWSEGVEVTVLESTVEDPGQTGDSDSGGEDIGPPQQGDSAVDTPDAVIDNPDDGGGPNPADHEGASSTGAHGPGLALWLLTLIVMVGGAVFVTGAIVREVIPKPPRV